METPGLGCGMGRLFTYRVVQGQCCGYNTMLALYVRHHINATTPQLSPPLPFETMLETWQCKRLLASCKKLPTLRSSSKPHIAHFSVLHDGDHSAARRHWPSRRDPTRRNGSDVSASLCLRFGYF